MPSLLLLGGAALLAAAPASVTFDDDLAFLRRHTSVIVLGEASGPRIAVIPAWLSHGGGGPGIGLMLLVAAIAIAGIISAAGATRAAVSGPLLDALRAE